MTNGQGSGSTETGAYPLEAAASGNAVATNAGRTFRLPTADEWYKRASCSPPLKNGAGGSDGPSVELHGIGFRLASPV